MKIEEAHRCIGGASTQVYPMLLREDEDRTYRCRLCATGASEGWTEEGTKCIEIPDSGPLYSREDPNSISTATPIPILLSKISMCVFH